jgi:hypothetical protein
MTNSANSANSANFVYSYARYRGQFTPANLIFNANLQEFSQRVSLISSLETAGKLSPDRAYQQIKTLCEQLEASRPK